MKIKRKKRSIEYLKSRDGLIFVSPWIFGFIVFFAFPLIQSIIYSFSEVTVVSGDVASNLIGISNYRNILVSDPNYLTYVKSSLTSFAYSLPIIMVLSLVLALFLNQKFTGRLFFRALYFLPVIIATGTVMDIMFSTTSEDISNMGISASLTAGMFSIEELTQWLGLNAEIATYVNIIVNNIFDLVWSCGIQIVLYLAGLQSIPSTLYEASRVEGATKWEEFWFITFPMLGRITLLVGVFTMVELIINSRNSIMKSIYALMRSGTYDRSSAMLWFYFLVAGAIMALIVLLYNKVLMKRWN